MQLAGYQRKAREHQQNAGPCSRFTSHGCFAPAGRGP